MLLTELMLSSKLNATDGDTTSLKYNIMINLINSDEINWTLKYFIVLWFHVSALFYKKHDNHHLIPL